MTVKRGPWKRHNIPPRAAICQLNSCLLKRFGLIPGREAHLSQRLRNGASNLADQAPHTAAGAWNSGRAIFCPWTAAMIGVSSVSANWRNGFQKRINSGQFTIDKDAAVSPYLVPVNAFAAPSAPEGQPCLSWDVIGNSKESVLKHLYSIRYLGCAVAA